MKKGKRKPTIEQGLELPLITESESTSEIEAKPSKAFIELQQLLLNINLSLDDLASAGIDPEALASILNLPWYLRAQRWLAYDETIRKILPWPFINKKHLGTVTPDPRIEEIREEKEDITEPEDIELEGAQEDTEKALITSDSQKEPRAKRCSQSLKQYFSSRVWPQANTTTFTSKSTLKKVYGITGFVDGLETVSEGVWAGVLFSIIVVDLYYYFTYPDQRYGNTLTNIFFAQSDNEVGLASALTLPTVWPELIALPIVWGIINSICRIRYAKVLDDAAYEKLMAAFKDYETKGWRDCGIWLLPWHRLQAMLNKVRLTLLWDGRITPEVREALFSALQTVAHQGTKLTQLHALSILAEIADFPQPKDLIKLHQQKVEQEALKQFLQIKEKAFSELKHFASSYQPQEKSQRAKTCFCRGFKPLPRYLYAHYLLWSLGQPQSKPLQPLFWLYKTVIFYLKARLLWTISKGIKIMIDRYIDKRDCEKEGKKWIYMERVGDYKCTVCGDYPIVYDQVFSNEDCINSWLAYPRIEEELIKAIKDFDFGKMAVLDFSEQRLSSDSLTNVLNALEGHIDQLQELYLSQSYSQTTEYMKNTTIQAIASLVKDSSIKILYLDHLLMGDNVAIVMDVLSETSIKNLSLSANAITPVGMQSISENLPLGNDIQYLDLGFNWIGDYGASYIAAMLKSTKTLQQLGLQDNQLSFWGTQQIAEALPYASELRWLDLGSYGDVKSLWNAISDWGLSAIAQNLNQIKNLQILSIENNDINDDGIIELAQYLTNSSLVRLFLRYNLFGAQGAQALANALPYTKQLKFLALDGCHSLGNEGALAFANILSRTINLEYLGLSLTDITDLGAYALAAALPNAKSLKVLQLGGNMYISEEANLAIINATCSTTFMQELLLTHNTIGNKGAKLIGEMLPQSYMQVLSAGDSTIDDSGIEAIANALPYATYLTNLILTNNRLTEKGLQIIASALSKAKNLRYLDLSYNSINSESGIKELIEKLSENNVNHLSLAHNSIDTKSAKAISDELTTFKYHPYIPWIYKINNADKKALDRADAETKLTFLDLSDNQISDSGAKDICKILPNTHIPVSQLGLLNNPISDPKLQHCAAGAADLMPWPIRMIWQRSQFALSSFQRWFRAERDTRIFLPEPEETSLMIEAAEEDKWQDEEIVSVDQCCLDSFPEKNSSSYADMTQQFNLLDCWKPVSLPLPSPSSDCSELASFSKPEAWETETGVVSIEDDQAASHQLVKLVEARAAGADIVMAWYVLYQLAEPVVTKTANTIMSFFFKPEGKKEPTEKIKTIPTAAKPSSTIKKISATQCSSSFFARPQQTKSAMKHQRRRKPIPEKYISDEEMAEFYLRNQRTESRLAYDGYR